MRPPTACAFCRSRRRRCIRLQDDRGPCLMCRKHNVPCVPCVPAAPTSASQHDAGDIASRSLGSGPTTAESITASQTEASSDSYVSRGLASQFQPKGQQEQTSPAATDHGETTEVIMPPMAVRFHLANMYFDYIHDQLHTLFQKPAFMSDLAMGKIPPVILFAMIALAARSAHDSARAQASHQLIDQCRFSSHDFFAGTSPRSRGISYARKGAELLNVSEVSLTSIQACVMLGACRIIEGDAPGESVYYGIACRMAQLLDLPHRACESGLEREIHIRGQFFQAYGKISSTHSVQYGIHSA